MSRRGHLSLGLLGLLLVAGISFWLVQPHTRSQATEAAPTALLPVPPPALAQATRPSEPTPLLQPTPSPTATSSPTPTPTPTLSPPSTASPPSVVVTLPGADVEALLAALTLEQKVAQMVMIGLPGRTVEEVARLRVGQQGFGGVILLPRNIEGEDQVRAFTAALQETALAHNPPIPLFIAWNHEGGDVVRDRAGLTRFPANMAVATGSDPLAARAIGRAVGIEMAALGVNMNYAPVLDVNTEHTNPVIGLRSYGEDPVAVGHFGAQYIAGLQEAGVIAVAKHFPGHGRTDVDSHEALPIVSASLSELWQVELPPFVAALEANVGAVMVAHLDLPALDPARRPSSLSPAVVTALLRGQLGYDGLVMTDDLGMGAIANQYSIEEAAIQAVAAGNDVLLTVEPYHHPDRILNALEGAVRSGRLDESTIDDAVRRILRLKLSYGLDGPPAAPPLVDREAHQELALQVGGRAVRVVRDQAGWLPLPGPPGRLLLISPTSANPGSTLGDAQSALAEQLAAQGIAVSELFYDPATAGSARQLEARARQALATADGCLVVLWDLALHHQRRGDTAQEDLVAALLQSDKPVVVVSGHLPYDDERLPFVPALVNLYGDGPGQIVRLVQLLLAG